MLVCSIYITASSGSKLFHLDIPPPPYPQVPSAVELAERVEAGDEEAVGLSRAALCWDALCAASAHHGRPLIPDAANHAIRAASVLHAMSSVVQSVAPVPTIHGLVRLRARRPRASDRVVLSELKGITAGWGDIHGGAGVISGGGSGSGGNNASGAPGRTGTAAAVTAAAAAAATAAEEVFLAQEVMEGGRHGSAPAKRLKRKQLRIQQQQIRQRQQRERLEDKAVSSLPTPALRHALRNGTAVVDTVRLGPAAELFVVAVEVVHLVSKQDLLGTTSAAYGQVNNISWALSGAGAGGGGGGLEEAGSGGRRKPSVNMHTRMHHLTESSSMVSSSEQQSGQQEQQQQQQQHQEQVPQSPAEAAAQGLLSRSEVQGQSDLQSDSQFQRQQQQQQQMGSHVSGTDCAQSQLRRGRMWSGVSSRLLATQSHVRLLETLGVIFADAVKNPFQTQNQLLNAPRMRQLVAQAALDHNAGICREALAPI